MYRYCVLWESRCSSLECKRGQGINWIIIRKLRPNILPSSYWIPTSRWEGINNFFQYRCERCRALARRILKNQDFSILLWEYVQTHFKYLCMYIYLQFNRGPVNESKRRKSRIGLSFESYHNVNCLLSGSAAGECTSWKFAVRRLYRFSRQDCEFILMLNTLTTLVHAENLVLTMM